MARLSILGVEVDVLTIPELNAAVAEAVSRGERWVIANHNMHSVYLFHHDAGMRRFYGRARITHIDGMALVHFSRMLGHPLRSDQRVTYVDWVRPLMHQAAQAGWRVFYLGGSPGVADRAARVLRSELPGLELTTRHGFFDLDGPENAAVLEAIRAQRPHVLMVGMGMPRQERWILENEEQIEANAILCAGACFDYVAGAVPTPPRFLGPVGMEWSYRLLVEPKRLWRRYLCEPWSLLPFILRDLARRGGGPNGV